MPLIFAPNPIALGRTGKARDFVLLGILCSVSVMGQAMEAMEAMEAIDTDGPDFVESSEVVDQGHLQYELDASAANASNNAAQKKLSSTPLLIKYGFAHHWELRIASDGDVNLDGLRGVGNTALGLKYHSQDRNATAGLPSISWIFHLQTPLASPQLRVSPALPSLRTVLTWDLPHEFALGLMPGLAKLTNDAGQTFTAGILGAVLNKQINNKSRVFIELSIPTFSKANQNGVVESFDVGGAYRLTHDTQWGFRAGLGLNANSPKNYFLLELDQRY
jgi:hypothetical protein